MSKQTNTPEADARWGALMTFVWSFVVMTVWQGVIIAIVAYRADRLSISMSDDAWISNPALSGTMLQAVILGGLLCVLMIFGVIRLKQGSQIGAYLPFKCVSVLDVVKWLLLTLFVIALWAMVTQYMGWESSKQMDELLKANNSPILAYIAVVLIAPIAEELLFRGFVISGLERLRVPDVQSIAVALSAFSWALLHMQYHAHEMFQVFLLGVVLGFARIKTQSLTTPVLIHVINNLVVMLVLSV